MYVIATKHHDMRVEGLDLAAITRKLGHRSAATTE